MIYEITFTCGKHAALAAQSDRPRAGVHRIWCVDTTDANINAPEGVEVWVVPFPRGGNLNGWECIEGMLSVFDRAFTEGARSVIKKDSDTAVLDDAPLAAFDPGVFLIGAHQFNGRTSPHQHNVFGCCYAISAEAIPIMRAGVEARDYANVPREDVTFSWFLRRHSRVLPWTAIRFLKNRQEEPGDKFAENCGNHWLPQGVPVQSRGGPRRLAR